MKNASSGDKNRSGLHVQGMTRRNLVKSAAAGLALPLLGKTAVSAAPRRTVRLQDAEKPASLNMLYATVEADVRGDQAGDSRFQG